MAIVLVIDDDPQVLEMWAEALSESGFDVRKASSGVEGVEIAREQKVDVVVTDLFMPDKDGIETLMEIKEVQPAVKVLAVSGGGMSVPGSFVEIADKLGADATLQKPVDLGRFCDLVEKLAKAS